MFELKLVADAGAFAYANNERRPLRGTVGVARNFRRLRLDDRQGLQKHCAVCGLYLDSRYPFEIKTFSPPVLPKTPIHTAEFFVHLHGTTSLDCKVSGYAAEQTFFIVPQYMVSSKSDLLTADQSRDALLDRRAGHEQFCEAAFCRCCAERI